MSYIALNASSKLTGVVGVGVTTVPVTAGTGSQFAVGSNHSYVTFQDATNTETCKITGQSGDNLTVVRTKSLSWVIGTVIECRPCAEAMADYSVAPQITGSAAAAIDDADELGLVDISASSVLKKITWANIKATLKTYFDTLYRAATGDMTLAAGATLVFEGSTDDGFETTVSAADPTADRSITLPDYSGAIAVQARGADIASAATVDLDAATGDIVDVTGTTAVTAITLSDGVEKSVRFTGVLTLTNGASLMLPGAANITTEAGDVAAFRGYAAGVVRCVLYQRASGLPLTGNQGVLQVVEATPITSVVSIATATTYDDTIPQNTEGTEIVTVVITPTNSGSRLRIEFDAGHIGTSSSAAVVFALFQNATANALAAASAYPAGTSGVIGRLSHEMAAGTTSATTFKIRISIQSGAAYLNGNGSGTRVFGGVSAARLRVTEIKV